MDMTNATPRRWRSALGVVRDISVTIMALSISLVIILCLKFGAIEGDGLSDIVKYGQPTVEPCEDIPDLAAC
jgi:hypothetical protein